MPPARDQPAPDASIWRYIDLAVATGDEEHRFHRDHRRPGDHRWRRGWISARTVGA